MNPRMIYSQCFLPMRLAVRPWQDKPATPPKDSEHWVKRRFILTDETLRYFRPSDDKVTFFDSRNTRHGTGTVADE